MGLLVLFIHTSHLLSDDMQMLLYTGCWQYPLTQTPPMQTWWTRNTQKRWPTTSITGIEWPNMQVGRLLICIPIFSSGVEKGTKQATFCLSDRMRSKFLYPSTD